MARLYNYETKQYDEVDDAQVDEAVLKTSHGFQEGIEVPITNTETGEVATVPSESYYEAIKTGRWRFQQKGDLENHAAREQDRIDQKHYGDRSVEAFTAGALRSATLGLSDTVMSAFGDDVKRGLDKLRKENEKSTLAGEIVGMFSPSGLGGIATKAAQKGAAKTIAKTGDLAGTTAAKFLPKISAKNAEKVNDIVRASMKTGIEGGIYGVGAGVSETALGNPEDIADNILSAGGLGALFGAGFGAGGKLFETTAAPAIKDISNKTTDFVEQTVNKAARGTAKKATAVWNRAVRDKYAKQFGELVDDPELRKVWDEFGPQEYEKTLKTVSKYNQQILKEYKKGLQNIDREIKTLPKKEQQFVKDLLLEKRGDLPALVKDMQNLKNSAYGEIKAMAQESLKNPATKSGEIIDDIQNFAKSLQKSKVLKKGQIKEIGRLADEVVDGTASSLKGAERAQYIASKVRTEGDEFTALWNINRRLNSISKQLSGESWQKVVDFQTKIIKPRLKTYSEGIGDLLETANKKDQAYKMVKDIYKRTVDSSVKKFGRGTPSEKKFVNLVSDPTVADEVKAAISIFDETTPLMQEYHKTLTTAADKTRIAQELQAKINKVEMNGKLADMEYDDVVKYIESFGKGKLDIDLTKMDELRQAMQVNPELSPMEAALRLRKIRGEDVSRSLEQMAKMDDGLRNMYQLSLLDKPVDSTSAELAKILLRASGVATVGYFDPTMGAILGGAGALKALRSPQKVLNGLNRIERWSHKGSQGINKRIQNLVNTLADPAKQKAAAKITVWTHTKEELQERKKTFKQRADSIRKLAQDPVAMEQMMMPIQDTLQAAPDTASAINTRMVSAAQFLHSKLPEDPFTAAGMPEEMSDWEPSDLELAQFERYVDATQNPSLVLDRLVEGSVTPEEIEALQVVYPNIYSRLQETALGAIVEHGTKIPYERRVMLGNLLDIPADYTLTPNFINAMQAGYEAEGKDQGGRPQGTGKAPEIEPKKDFLTEYDKITYGVNR